MRRGHTPVHILRWAPADYLGDPFVRRCYQSRDYLTVAFYSAFLFYSHLEGGHLPANIDDLAAIVLMPKRHVAKALEICRAAGKIQEENSRLFHWRIKEGVERELAFRFQQAVVGRKGGLARAGRVAQGPPSDDSGPPTPDASAERRSSTSAPALDEKALAVPPSNPLVADRSVLEAECLALVREIAEANGRDAAEVMAEAGTWNGSRKLNPASMTVERLLNTVLDLRRMKNGGPARAAPPERRALARQDAALALIRGGLRND